MITMYATTWCGDCIRSKDWLDNHKIVYQEVDIEENREAMTFVEKVNHGMHSVPTIVFPDGSILVEPSSEELKDKIKELKLTAMV